MAGVLDPVLRKDLADAKAAVARHGIVIVRNIETELLPAIVAAARDSISASPEKLSSMEEEELDELMDELRQTASKSVADLMNTLVRVLADIGSDDLADVTKTLDGVDMLFKWERIAKAAESTGAVLSEYGFEGISLPGPGYVSEGLELELEERWPLAFQRFRGLAIVAAEELSKVGHDSGESSKPSGVTRKGGGKRARKR